MSHHHYAKEERLINKTLFSSTTILPSEDRRAEDDEKPCGNHSSALNLLASLSIKALDEWKKSGKSFFAFGTGENWIPVLLTSPVLHLMMISLPLPVIKSSQCSIKQNKLYERAFLMAA